MTTETSGVRVDGSERRTLTSRIGNNTMPTTSPDGTAIVFVSQRTGKTQLWRMNADGHDLAQLTDIAFDLSHPQYSRDGQAVFFTAWVDGRNQIWQISSNGGEPSQVIDADVYEWTVAPDGVRIAFSSFDAKAGKVQTRIHWRDHSIPDQVLDLNPETWMLWAPDGQALYFNIGSDSVRNIWRQGLDGSPPKQITDFTDKRIFHCQWSRDSERLACVRQAITFDAVKITLE